MLRGVAVHHRVTIGSSFLCRDRDGEVRNAFMLVLPDGTLASGHDKDLPTMWDVGELLLHWWPRRWRDQLGTSTLGVASAWSVPVSGCAAWAAVAAYEPMAPRAPAPRAARAQLEP
jgi:hypothetical protein